MLLPLGGIAAISLLLSGEHSWNLCWFGAKTMRHIEIDAKALSTGLAFHCLLLVIFRELL